MFLRGRLSGGQPPRAPRRQREEPRRSPGHPGRRPLPLPLFTPAGRGERTVLMIRRRCGESILLGEDIEIRVLEIAGSRVKLGISAPRQVLVLREELKLTEDFNRQASRPVPSGHLHSLAAVLKTHRTLPSPPSP